MTLIHQLHLGHVRLPDSHPRAAELTCAIFSYTIDHPDGAIVIDTGLEIIIGQACYTCAEYDASTVALTDMHAADWHTTGLDTLARLRTLRPDRAHFSRDAATYRRISRPRHD